MFDKVKNLFLEKDEKKKIENLIAFLIILIITLIIVNKILSGNKQAENIVNETETELVTNVKKQVVEVNTDNEYSLKQELEDTLSKISGVGKVQVLLTYTESSSISPLYNESISSSTSTDSQGTTTETKTESKDIFTDNSKEAVTQKVVMPKLEGAIVIAEGAGNVDIKANILSAMEAATGLLSHKIQIFEMKWGRLYERFFWKV